MTDFTTPGPGSWVADFTGNALVMCWGAGGGGAGGTGGANGGGGGGGGALAYSAVPVVLGNTYNFVVGGGGGGGAWGGNAGTDGGDTTWETSVIVAQGGRGSPGSRNAGAGGAIDASTGDTRIAGQAGATVPSFDWNGGAGGDAGGADGGAGGASNGQDDGLPGAVPGGGGSGGGQATNSAGGSGGAGMVRIIAAPATVPGFTDDKTANTAGSHGWTAPADGIIVVECYGGGGGANAGQALGNGGAGGGGGAYSLKAVPVTKGVTYTRLVGAGGSGGAYSSGDGGPGGDTSFKDGDTVLVLAKGGTQGTGTTSGAGTGGQAASGVGDTKNSGFNGVTGTSTTQTGGAGGNGALPNGGAGGAGGANSGGGLQVGKPGGSPGGGGGGGSAISGGNGGPGSDGAVYLSYYLTYGSVVVDGAEKFIVGVKYKDTSGVVHDIDTFSRVPSGVKVDLGRCRPNLSAGARALPSYTPVGLESLFDVTKGTLNYTTPNLAAALAAGDAEIVVFGDSVAEGWTYLNNLPPFDSTEDFPNAWPRIARNKLAEHYGLEIGGTGLIRPASVNNIADPQWSVGSWNSDDHYISSATSGAWATFTPAFPGTSVALVMIGTGVATVQIDGVTVGTTTPGATDTTVTRTVFSGLDLGRHVVRIARTTGTARCAGCDVYTPGTGVRVHNVAQGGSSASGTGQPAWADTSGGTLGNMLPVYSQLATVFGRRPDAIIVALGGNDLHAGASAATIKTAHQTIIAAVAGTGTDIILVPDYHGSNSYISDAFNVYSPMWAALMQLAADDGHTYIDLDWLTLGYEGLAGRGYTGDVYGHPSTEGHKYIGGLAAQILQA